LRRAYDYWQNQPGCCPSHTPFAPPVGQPTGQTQGAGMSLLFHCNKNCRAERQKLLHLVIGIAKLPLPSHWGRPISTVRVPMLHTQVATKCTAAEPTQGHPAGVALRHNQRNQLQLFPLHIRKQGPKLGWSAFL